MIDHRSRLADRMGNPPPASPTPFGADAPTDASLDGVPPLDACVARAELCNGRDDDCDRTADEDFPTVGDACEVGIGACRQTGHLPERLHQ